MLTSLAIALFVVSGLSIVTNIMVLRDRVRDHEHDLEMERQYRRGFDDGEFSAKSPTEYRMNSAGELS